MPTPCAHIDLESRDLTPAQFRKISDLLYALSGICLGTGKEGLLKSRLGKRLRTLGLAGFDEYIRYFESDRTGQELTVLVDALATNKTSFFRELPHFEFLRHVVLPEVVRSPRGLRIWSAGCSSGEEPYSVAILLAEELTETARKQVRILATDISTKILAAAREGVYPEEAIRDLPARSIQRHFTCVQSGSARQYRVNDDIRAMVRLARLNLMEDWPIRGPFDVIFCRNVMIYFDVATRERLVRRFGGLLRPGGYLFVGHSESLTGLSTPLKYVQPAVYRR